MTGTAPDNENYLDLHEAPRPGALQALRDGLGSINDLTQREVDQVLERLRSARRAGRHRA